jgi:hypothetical protein
VSRVAIRAYTRKSKKRGGDHHHHYTPPDRHQHVLVFDTETTIDEYQNFRVGFFEIYQDGYYQHCGAGSWNWIFRDGDSTIAGICHLIAGRENSKKL